MDLYRVWQTGGRNSYWLLGESEVDAIETVSMTIGVQETQLNAALDREAKYNVPRGVILNGAGHMTTFFRD
jgi:hypothetical protein